MENRNFLINGPDSANQIAHQLIQLPTLEGDALLTALMETVQTIVTGVAVSYSPEHCEPKDDSHCSAPEQHYPWSLLRLLADRMEEWDAENPFDAYRENFHNEYAQWEMSQMAEQLASMEDLKPEDITGGKDAES